MSKKQPKDNASFDYEKQLIRTCRTTLGDNLRSVIYLTSEDYEQVYLRDDLEQNADVDAFADYEWRGFGLIRDAYEGSELGDYKYTIRVYDNGFLVGVTTETEGVFVTTDGLTNRDLEEMASAIKAILT